MPYQHTITLIDGPRGGFDVVAEIDYVVHPACGDGWNEPREPAHAEILSVTLYKVTEFGRYVPAAPANEHGYAPLKWVVERTTREPLPGPTPDWVSAVLEQNEWWTDVEIEEAA